MKNYCKKITPIYLSKNFFQAHKLFLTKWLSLTTMPEVLSLLGQSMFIMEGYLPALPLGWKLLLQLHALAKTFILSCFSHLHSLLTDCKKEISIPILQWYSKKTSWKVSHILHLVDSFRVAFY